MNKGHIAAIILISGISAFAAYQLSWVYYVQQQMWTWGFMDTHFQPLAYTTAAITAIIFLVGGTLLSWLAKGARSNMTEILLNKLTAKMRLRKIVKKPIEGLLKYAPVFLVFLALSVIAFRLILFTPGVISMTREWMIPQLPGQIKDQFVSNLYAWKPGWDYGIWTGSPAGLYFYGFLYSLTLFGMDGAAITKFLGILTLTLAGCSMFYLCKRLQVKTVPAIVAGISYMLAPTVFDLMTQGHVHILLDYSLAPLAISLFRDVLKSKQTFRFVALGSILILIGTSHISSFYLLFIMFVILLFAHSLSKRSMREFFLGLRYILVVFGLAFILHGYGINVIQQITFNSISARMGNLSTSIIGSQGNSPLDILRLLRPGSMLLGNIAKSWQPWQILSFLPIIMAFSIFLLKPKDERVISFGALAVIGITLATGSQGLLGSSWSWIIENIIIMRVFRDPAKFISILNIGYSVLLGLFVEAILGFSSLRLSNTYIGFISASNYKMKAISMKLVSAILLFVLTTSLILASSWPAVTGDFGGTIQTYDFGEKYANLYQWLSEDPEDYRVLMLPAPYPTVYNDQKFKNLGGTDVEAYYAGKPSLYTGKNYDAQMETFLFKTLYENRTNRLGNLLGISNVKYVVLDTNKRTVATDMSYAPLYFPSEQFTNDKLVSTLNQQTDLSLYSVDGTLSVWANEKNLPHVYPVNQIGLLAGDLDALVDATYSQSVQLQNIGILFASQLSSSDIVSISKLPNVRIIIQQNHFLDLVLASVPSNYELSPITYTNESSPYNGWAPMFWGWHNWYYQAPLERLVFTEVPSALAMPYTALQTGNYHLSMKLYFGPQASNVKVFLDDKQISDINTKTSEELGFNWVSINSILLEQGTHQLKIQSAQGENVVARVNLAPENVITNALSATAALMTDREVDIISKLRLQNSTEDTLAINPSDLIQAIQNATFTRRHPSGEPYSVDVDNNSLLLNLYFSHNASISESLSTELPLQTNVDLTIYQNFEIAIKLSDSQKTNLYPLLLVDVGNSTHAWLRLVPISARAQSSITLRDDGNYDIWYPIAPSTDTQGYSVFQADLFEALRNFFPGEQSFNITGIRFNFAKSAGVSLADKNAGSFTFSIKDLEFFGSPWYTTQIGVDASEGFVVSSFSSMPTSFFVYVPKSTSYNILLRGTSDASPCLVTAKINSSEFNFTLNPKNNSSDWHDIGQVDLDQGNTTIIFQSDATDRINLDQLNLVESPNSPDPTYKIDNFTCQNINPSKYLLTGQSNQPFFVVFSESYSSLWKIALPDGSKISSYPAYSFGNLYFVNSTGDFQATLECEAQGLQDVMMDLAFGLFAFLILSLVAPTLFQRISQIKAIYKKKFRPHS